jgi:hypothetical protein
VGTWPPNFEEELMKSWKAIVVVLGTATMVLGAAGTAGADPTNAKKGEILTIECDAGLGSLTVALNGNGEFTPGHVTTSTQVGIPYAFHIEGSFTPSGGGEPETFVDDSAKPGPRNGRLASCTFHEEGQDENGTFVFDGTVKISYTKAH